MLNAEVTRRLTGRQKWYTALKITPTTSKTFGQGTSPNTWKNWSVRQKPRTCGCN